MTSEIKFEVQLDKDRFPEKIYWNATDNPNEGINETKAICVGVWDHYHRGLLAINLWTKDMPVDEMNHFTVDMVGSLAQMVRDSTQDPKIVAILEDAGRQMNKHLQELAKEEQAQAPQSANSLDDLLEQTKARLKKD